MHYNLGDTLSGLNRLNEAIASFNKALATNPVYPEAYSSLGKVLLECGRYDDAKRSYNIALAIKPDFVEAHRNLAISLVATGRRSEALEHFGKRLEMERGDSPVNPQDRSFRFISKAKIRHDIEQFNYLVSQELDNDQFIEFANLYESI